MILKNFFSGFCKYEYLVKLPVVLIWAPVEMYGIINDKEWVSDGWYLLLGWMILTELLCPLFIGLAAMLFDALKKNRH